MNRSPQSPGTSAFLDHIESSPGGRFAEQQRRERLAAPQIIGTSATAQYPKLPFNPFENDQAPEPLIDASDCGLTYNIPLGEPHEQPTPLSSLPPIVDGAAPTSAVVEQPQSIKEPDGAALKSCPALRRGGSRHAQQSDPCPYAVLVRRTSVR
jgi:hypothetical protein